MNIEEKNFITYSRIGSRATYGLVILELVRNNKNIIVIPADTSTSAGLDRLKKQFPENAQKEDDVNKLVFILYYRLIINVYKVKCIK